MLNVTGVDHHIQYGSVTPDSFYIVYSSGIMGHFYTSEIH